MIVFNKTLQDLALSIHNNYRNKIANGDIEGYDRAARMATLVSRKTIQFHQIRYFSLNSLKIFIFKVWSDELAELAALTVKKCAFKHDTCSNTGEIH